MAEFPLIGIPSSFLVPGIYLETNFNQGPSTAGAGERYAIYVMPKSSSGTWTANTVYQVKNEGEAAEGAGVGSPLHRALRMHLSVPGSGRVYALPYAESSDGATAADGYVDINGTATTRGTLSFTVCGESIDIGINKNDTATTIADTLEGAINARTHLPCTASNSSGEVTLTAKVAGASQGNGTVGVIRFRASKSGASGITLVTSGAALGLGDGTAGSDGSTTEAANFLAALNTITADRYYYIGTSQWDSTSLDSLTTHVTDKSLANPGLRSVWVGAFTGALAAAQTLATGQNFARGSLAYQRNSEVDPASIVGNVLAIRQKYESLRARYNFDGFSLAGDWHIPAVYDSSDKFDSDDLNDAISDGLSPIQSGINGSYLVGSFTTRSKNDAGTVDDRRAADTHRVAIVDEITDTCSARGSVTFSGFNLKDDVRLADGSIDPNQDIPAQTVTPSLWKRFVVSIIREFEDSGDLKNVDATVANTTAQIDPTNSSRIESEVPLDTVNVLHQITVRVNEVSAG